MPKVLVTGASGFIGGHLVPSLIARGDQVRCLVRPSSQTDLLRQAGAELICGDAADGESLQRAVQGCQVVYHLAGKTSALQRKELYQVNGWGTHLLARACARQETPPLLLVVSSLAAAGTSPPDRHRTEADTPRPISEYGRSKRAGELAAAAWGDRIPISIVRPGIVFGPRNTEMLPIFRSIWRFRVHAVPGFQPRPVSLIHQEDLIEIIHRTVQQGRRIDPRENSGASAGYYFATAPEFPSYADLGRMIGTALGRPAPLNLLLTETGVWLAALGSELLARRRRTSDSFNLDKIREALAGNWTCSPRRVYEELGFQPPRSLQQRLTETAQWYLEHGWL